MKFEKYFPLFSAHYFILQTLFFVWFIRCVRKIVKSNYQLRHVCLSVRMEQRGSHCTDFHAIWYLSISQKYVGKIQDLLKSDKNDGHFTRGRMYVYDKILLNSS
jgi:hypothetical protein